MTKLYTLTDINQRHLSRHLSLADAGRERAEISDGSFAVVLGSYHGRDALADDEVNASPDSSERTETWSVVSRDRSGVWRGTTCYGTGRSADCAWEKFAFVPGRDMGNQGWRDVRGDVLSDEDYDAMIAQMIAQDDTDALECHSQDERAATHLASKEAE